MIIPSEPFSDPEMPGDSTQQIHHKLLSVGALSLGVAHDLNNIFTGMLYYTHLLNEQIKDPSQLNHIQSIQKSIGRAVNLTRSMVTLVRDEVEVIHPINPVKHVQEVVRMMKGGLGEHIACCVTLPPTEMFVRIKESHLTQLVLNLLLNARDAIDEAGTIAVTGSFEPEPTPTHFMLAVSDTGKGIPQDEWDRIFQPFYTTKVSANGLGLGLTIVKSIVDKAGGTVQVYSAVGQGSRFTVHLPIEKR